MSTLASLASRPIRTEPNTTHYEWAGGTLQRLLGADRRVAETWAFFSGPTQPAQIADTGAGGGVTMAELVAAMPEVLGPAGGDPENHRQKYFFVKFLDPSDFPKFAYVGFDPEAVRRLGTPLKPHVAELLWRDRQAVESLAALIRPQVRSRATFERFKAAYKQWAIAQAEADWAGEAVMDLAPFVAPSQRPAADALLTRQLTARRGIVGLMHRIDFQEDQAILVETPTLHAIAGLSLQIHPKATGNFHPKDELWIYRELPLPDGATGWILVEPQRTFDRTESGADFFTPFAWEETGGGTLGFRKPITKAFLDAFVSLMDATPHPKAHYLRAAARMTVPRGTTLGAAQWSRLVEEPAWPYFLARELRFDGQGEAVTPLEHHSFIELHATRGEIEVTLSGRQPDHRFAITPARPAFLPASLPYETIAYRARAAACLQFFTRSSGIA